MCGRKLARLRRGGVQQPDHPFRRDVVRLEQEAGIDSSHDLQAAPPGGEGGDVITADFEFNYPVRFDTDRRRSPYAPTGTTTGPT